MAKAKPGDTVRVRYKGILEDGTLFDETEKEAPLVFLIGEGSVIPIFEHIVVGMSPGEIKSQKIHYEQGFGPSDENKITVMDRDKFPKDAKLEIGEQVELKRDDGRPYKVSITKVTDDKVTLDGNHPLAGKNFSFEIELLSIDE